MNCVSFLDLREKSIFKPVDIKDQLYTEKGNSLFQAQSEQP